MKSILHLTVDGAHFWRKASGQWLPVEAPDKGAVWVVSDLAEESLTEIQIPRLFGRDRSNYIDRQLKSRFPDTPYKSMLAAAAPASLLDRIAPRRQSLLALEAKDRVNDALDELKADVAGVCDPSGRILGLMPHPERFIDATKHPCWNGRLDPRSPGDGLAIFVNAVRAAG